MGQIVAGSGGVFSPWPFDKGENLRAQVLQESFITAAALADADTDLVIPGTFVYADELGVAGANVTLHASEAGHPGIVTLESGGGTAGDGIVVAFGKVNALPLVLSEDYFVGSALIRPANAASVANIDLFVGFRQAALAVPAGSVDGDFGYLFEGGATAAQAVSNEGTADEEVDFSTIPVLQEWLLVEVALNENGGYVRVSSEDTVEVAKLTTAPDSADTYQFCVAVSAVGTEEALVDLDTLQLRQIVSETSDVDSILVNA